MQRPGYPRGVMATAQLPAVPDEVRKLVDRFARNRAAYLSDGYKEAQLRQEFIDPLFAALGWDMANVQGYAEAYKDVIHEASLKTAAGTKAPDYCMRIGGIRKFFVEAKKPAVNIKMASDPAYQLRRYAWSAKLPLSILTNFDGLAVYDCTRQPRQLEDPAIARLKFIQFDELIPRWQELSELFSKDAVLKGYFDTFAVSAKSKRGTLEVDDAFLSAIDGWRTDIARNVSRRNRALSEEDLNWVVQQTIDRIVFLRICEDRGIEPYGQLMDAAATRDAYASIGRLFVHADARYNSGLFHFSKEKHRDPPDTLSLTVRLDTQVLRGVIRELYYPESPYEFSVLPPDILGQVYEQFLGKRITLTDKGSIRIDYKPEVAKAGGVYYTPSHIARHIARTTVAPLLETASLTALRSGTATLRVVDPACGSGTFLLVAYELVMQWYLEQYSADPTKWASSASPPIREDGHGGWRLTTAEKKAILVRHIFGVDLDPRAVEVTKLSLLLKVLEGESQESVDRQIDLFHERALPDLDANVKCGNSLVHPEYLVSGAGKDIGAAERASINAFDWSTEFPDVFDQGGFEAVVGNPPWLMAGYHVKPVLPHFAAQYRTARGKYDMYYLFIEKALNLAAEGGRVGLIVPNKFFHTSAAAALRKLLADSERLEQVVDFGESQVFSRATNYSCIVILGPRASGEISFSRVTATLELLEAFSVDQKSLTDAPWHFEDAPRRGRFARTRTGNEPLGRLVSHFGNGVQTGADKILLLKREAAEALGLEAELLRPFLRGRDVRRYAAGSPSTVVIFPYKVIGDQHVLLSEKELAEFPKVLDYLQANREALDRRVWFGKSAAQLSGAWYGLMYVDRPDAFAAGHLLTPSLAGRTNFALSEGHVFATGTAGVTSATVRTDVYESAPFLMAVLNSKLLSNYAAAHSPVFRGGYRKFSGRYIENLPIRRIRATSPSDVKAHDRLHELGQRRAQLTKHVQEAATPHSRTALSREVDEIDHEIDRCTFELYALSKADMAAVLAEEVARARTTEPRDDASPDGRGSPVQ